ncbi:hypothetical protein J3R83DRAFT_4226 [Lanmaoa asiatica]|nr:hypothetical protein J3R83DRAFT_4226 [Lanmaoa asiatica]
MDPSPTSTSLAQSTTTDSASAHHASPVVAFIIGFAIILLASVLNAAGLNLTKLDHVRTNAIPKSARRRDWLRPLWLLGMTLYILSQLIGSTLALDYMRAGRSFVPNNTLVAHASPFRIHFWLEHQLPKQIYMSGTIIVVLGVIGIVAFGGINSGLSSETNVDHLTALWRRGGWLAFFFTMSIALLIVLKFTYSLDAVLVSRSDITSEPFTGMSARRSPLPSATLLGKAKNTYASFSLWIKEKLEIWTAPKDDRQIAWILGIGWACCGGGLAGGCLVFAKATYVLTVRLLSVVLSPFSVKLLTGSLSHENPGNQFGHIAPIFTIILLVITAVLQIICLNRGLKVYDSTLVVPVFYGVYTATGFLDSLVFNNGVDAYKPWILFLIFTSIVILVSGVVLLTHKKPERSQRNIALSRTTSARSTMKDGKDGNEEDEAQALRVPEEGQSVAQEHWQLGDMSDDEGDGIPADTIAKATSRGVNGSGDSGVEGGEEERRLIQDEEEERTRHRRSTSSDATLARNDGDEQDIYHDDEFGEWNEGGKDYNPNVFRITNALTPPSAMSYSAQELHSFIHEGYIDLNPSYQRDVVWPESKQIGLIDSIFRNFYVPPVIFAIQKDDDGETVRVCVDGKQRLTSIQKFLDGLVNRDARTKKSFWFVTSDAQKTTRLEIPDHWKRRFTETRITCVEYHSLPPGTEREIFQRVQLGMSLTAAEKLQAISSSWADWISDLEMRHVNCDGGLAEVLEWDTRRGRDFQCIAQMVYCCDLLPEHALPSAQKLEKWLSRVDKPNQAFKNNIGDALNEFGHIAMTPGLNTAFEQVDKRVAPVEFVFIGTLLYILREHTHHERANAVLHMRLRIREQFRDVRNNGNVGKALWNFIDSLMGPSGLKILSSNKSYSVAPTPSSQRKRKKVADDDEDEEYHPSPVRTLGQGVKTRGKARRRE